MLKFVLLAAALAASALTAWVILGQFSVVAWLCCFATGFVASKLMLTNMMPMGHGVNHSWHILGMPAFLFGAYLLILVLILALGWTAKDTSLSLATNTNFEALGFAPFYGWAAMLIDWYGQSSQLTYYHTEYGFRVALKAHGYSDEEMEKEVAKLRKEGLLAPLSKEEKAERDKLGLG